MELNLVRLNVRSPRGCEAERWWGDQWVAGTEKYKGCCAQGKLKGQDWWLDSGKRETLEGLQLLMRTSSKVLPWTQVAR